MLKQDGRPIEYALKALAASEPRWAQNEMDAMAVLFGAQRFDQYTKGRRIVVENYHGDYYTKTFQQCPYTYLRHHDKAKSIRH